MSKAKMKSIGMMALVALAAVAVAQRVKPVRKIVYGG